MLGHTPTGVVTDNANIRCIGFQTIVARAVEWAATGAVTISVPADFPMAERESLGGPIRSNADQTGRAVR